MHEKSEAAKLYYCDNINCLVVTFKRQDICPSCGNEGLLVREPTVRRHGLSSPRMPTEEPSDVV